VKRLVALCVAGWLVAGAAGADSPAPKPVPLTKEQQEKLQERDRFQKGAEKLRAEGKLAEAMVAAEKMLAIERDVLGSTHPDVAGSLEFLAEMHEALEEFTPARRLRQEVLAIQTKLLGADHWQVTNARLARCFGRRLSSSANEP
jgi:hypothetical protein